MGGLGCPLSSCDVERHHVLAGCKVSDWQGWREETSPPPVDPLPWIPPSLSKWDISPAGKL